MQRDLRYKTLLLILFIGFLLPFQDLIPFSFSSISYEPVREIKANQAYMTDDGEIIYHFEVTREPSEEEKRERELWFENEWERLRKKTPTENIGGTLKNFFRRVFELALETGYSQSKAHIINQPVVTKAGFILESLDGVKTHYIPIDLAIEYGNHTWERFPNLGVNIKISQNKRFLVLETERGNVTLYELSADRKIKSSLKLPVKGSFEFSRDNRLFVVVTMDKMKIYSLPPESCRLSGVCEKESKEYIPFVPPFRMIHELDIRSIRGKIGSFRDIIVTDLYIGLLGPKGLYLYSLKDSMDGIISVGGRGLGGRSLVGDDEYIYIAGLDGALYKVHPTTKMVQRVSPDRFHLLNNLGIYFHKIVSISPDGRYVAALFDPGLVPPKGAKSWSGESSDRSKLFIWDLKEGKTIFRFEEDFYNLASGYNIQRFAYLTSDWKYLLIKKRDGTYTLFKRRF